MGKQTAKTGPRVKRSRTRSGCFTCRDRHMKCDELLPVCQNCINSKRRCYRGIRLNFSSYNYYDPRSTGTVNDINVPAFHRILDQSIAVSKLYKNGYRGYKPYRHLHINQDLAEAEKVLHNELQINQNNASANISIPPVNTTEPETTIQPEDLTQFLDHWLYTDLNVSQAMRSKIRENSDITKILMNPELHDKQLGGVMRADFYHNSTLFPDGLAKRKNSFAPSTAPELYMLPQDADGFIRLIHQQKYFWLLDLFNDLRIWESCIPSYCVRLYQASEMCDMKSGYDEKFLFHCLLLCDERVTVERILEMSQFQYQRWREFDNKDVVFSTYHAFEKILLSIVLILLSILIHSTRPGFTLNSDLVMILANQGRLIQKLTARFIRLPSATLKKLDSVTFTVAAFQAIVIIRFFLKMIFCKLEIECRYDLSSEKYELLRSSDLEISYARNENHDISEFFTLTETEVSHLCDDYSGFDHGSGKKTSDAKKLRVKFWELVLRDHQVKSEKPDLKISPDLELESSSEEEISSSSQLALIPNSRCLAMNIVNAHSNKLWGDGETKRKSSKTLVDIFQKIRGSAMPRDIKSKWVSFFDWSSSA